MRSAHQRGSASSGQPSVANWTSFYNVPALPRSVEGRRRPQYLAIKPENVCSIRPAQRHRTLKPLVSKTA